MSNMKENKNILELCLSDGLGGLELFVASCYKQFSKKTSCKIAIAPDSKLDDYLQDKSSFFLKRSKFFPIFPAFKLAKYIDEHAIDIIHFHWNKDILIAVLAKTLSKKKPKLVQSRHMGMTRFKDDFYHRLVYKNIDTIHAVTLKVKEQLKKFIPKDIRPEIKMVYLGTSASIIDENKIFALKQKYNLEDTFIIGIVGRIEAIKGQYKVIEALAQLKNLNVKAFIVGSAMDEAYLDELMKKAKNLGVEEHIIFTGFTKNVNEYMQLFDVNILATENETFGLVVIEAMVNRVPMIATNKGGPLEIINDGVDGLLFDGSSEDLAKKINLLINEKELRQELIVNASLKVMKKFDLYKQLDILYKIIGRNNEVEF